MNHELRIIAFRILQVLLAFLLCVLLFPPSWYSDSARLRLSQWFGTPGYLEPDRVSSTTATEASATAAEMCPPDIAQWRSGQQIEGVDIAPSLTCLADNPYAVAAFVKGTNNVSAATLMQAGLTPDAVEKSNDLDGDGDPDEIHIRLEVAELNGGSPDISDPLVQFPVAPGIMPGLWVFAPKSFGMATVNFESNMARDSLRLPSPVIRVEQGDKVTITLENTHYMKHTIHFHGVDHPFADENGNGNDGAPVSSELPLEPGSSRSYEFQPRQPGTMFYHCHVQVQVHVMMGLQGMFVVEENRPNNWVQTFNIGAGQVRVPSAAITEIYDQEYDLHFTDLDMDLNERIRQSNDRQEIEQLLHRDYDITDATSDLFTLNGKSFPYTFQESLIITEPNELIKLRVLNAGGFGLSLHSHGHKLTATHYDGVALSPAAQITRDVFWLSSAQRTDLELSTVNDGLHSYGSGVWLLHDHQQRGVTNDGLAPGGNLGAIVYKDYLGTDGWPRTLGEDLTGYFSADYYRRSAAPDDGGAGAISTALFLRLLALGIAAGVFAAGIVSLITIFRRRSS